MNYQSAKEIFDELKNFEGKATFQGSATVIDLFVLLPQKEADEINPARFLDIHNASGSFEIEGDHDDDDYTIVGINTENHEYSNDMEYFRKLLVW